MAAKSFSKLDFASLLVYSPRGQSQVSKTSRNVRDKVRAVSPATLAQAITRLGEVFDASGFGKFLGPDVVLVPTPGSSPRYKEGLWVPHTVATELVAAGFGAEVVPLLQRIKAVPKSAYAAPGERPDVATHIDSMAAESVLLPALRITLIDDFVTKGRTLFGAASVLSAAFPEAEVRAFALVRTMGLVEVIDQILAPCVGSIELHGSGEDVDRNP